MEKEQLAEAKIRQIAKKNLLSCAKAFQLSKELEISPLELGRIVDKIGIKIVECQLGCFGKRSN